MRARSFAPTFQQHFIQRGPVRDKTEGKDRSYHQNFSIFTDSLTGAHATATGHWRTRPSNSVYNHSEAVALLQ